MKRLRKKIKQRGKRKILGKENHEENRKTKQRGQEKKGGKDKK